MEAKDRPPLESEGGATGIAGDPGSRGRFGLAPSEPRKRSWAWFLLPVFVDIIGGVLAYWALRLDSPRMARDCLYVGITLTAVKAITMAATIAVFAGIGEDPWWGMDGEIMIDDPALLEECLEGTVGFDGTAASIDRDGAMACLRAHALGATPSE